MPDVAVTIPPETNTVPRVETPVKFKLVPVALSIVQARLVGLAHFAVGYILTYAAFLIASTSGKFG